MRPRALALAAIAVLGLAPAAAQDAAVGGPVAMRTADDSRGWDGVGRIDIGGSGFCTGALIADDLVLTAAHCLFDKETGTPLDPAAFEFRAGWRNGRATAYRGVRRALAHPGYDASEPEARRRVSRDVALLELDAPVRNTTVVPYAIAPRPAKGADVGVVSYARGREDSPSLERDCTVLAREVGGTLILSCAVDFGASGAPVFQSVDGEDRIVSVISGMAEVRGRKVALGTSLEGPLADLRAALEQNDGVFARTSPPVVRRTGADSGPAEGGAKFLRP